MNFSSETISNVLRTMREVAEHYKMAVDGQVEAEGIENDLRHDLELNNLTYHERAKIATKMQETLRERRRYKDYSELLSPIASWYAEAQAVIKSLERVLGEMRKIEEKHKNRRYYRRSENGKQGGIAK